MTNLKNDNYLSHTGLIGKTCIIGAEKKAACQHVWIGQTIQINRET